MQGSGGQWRAAGTGSLATRPGPNQRAARPDQTQPRTRCGRWARSRPGAGRGASQPARQEWQRRVGEAKIAELKGQRSSRAAVPRVLGRTTQQRTPGPLLRAIYRVAVFITLINLRDGLTRASGANYRCRSDSCLCIRAGQGGQTAAGCAAAGRVVDRGRGQELGQPSPGRRRCYGQGRPS